MNEAVLIASLSPTGQTFTYSCHPVHACTGNRPACLCVCQFGQLQQQKPFGSHFSIQSNGKDEWREGGREGGSEREREGGRREGGGEREREGGREVVS